MLCRMMKLMLVCGTLSLSSCATKPPIDDFCVNYTKVVVEKGDGEIKAKTSVKKRILINEQLYRECTKPDG